jgi:hypothetical protein
MLRQAKSGPQIAEEHVQSLIAVLASFGGKPLPRYQNELNRTAIAKLCGFDRKVFQTNPRCAELIASADADDRKCHLDALAQAELGREDKARVDQDRAELEALNLRLMAENASLKVELERFRRLERLMAESGKLA